MKNVTKKLFVAAAVAIGLAGTLAAQPANAQVNVSIGTVRVRLPNGTYLSLGNTPDRPWWYDSRVAPYRRYIYDPVQRVYVVHSDAYFVRHPSTRYTVIDRRSPPRRGNWHDNGGHGNGHRDNGWHGRDHDRH
jgi:P pilus assembly chaperone PapD